MVDAAAARSDRFQRLVLIDPVIASPDAYGGGGWTIAKGQTHPTAKRKRRFASAEEMFERFVNRVPYAVFERDALAAYCTHGLLPAEEGEGLELACLPEIEASIYMTSRTNAGIHDSLRALRIPVLLLRDVMASHFHPLQENRQHLFTGSIAMGNEPPGQAF